MFTTKSKGVHSHIKGLGLNDQGLPTDTPYSIIGQEKAREAAGLIVELVRHRNIAGRCVLIVGPTGCGKSALAVGISEELGIKTPFNILNASEINSKEIRKTEILQEAVRKSMGVRIKEFKNIYEGEVVGLNIQLEEGQMDNEEPIVREISISLRATKGTKTFNIGSDLYQQIVQQNIKKGDIVYIETSAGIIKNMGRGESYMNDYDLESEKYVPLPKGDIFRKKEVVQETTLHSLDLSFVKPTGQDVISLVSQVCTTKKMEITEKLREEVDQMIKNYIEVDKAELIPGVLVIEEAHRLDVMCFSYLRKLMDSNSLPLIILSSNNLSSTEETTFGIPRDFLRKLIIIPMKRSAFEIEHEIIKARLTEEDITINEEALNYIGELLKTNTLRYTLSLVCLLKTLEREIVKQDLEELCCLFKSVN